MTVVNILYIMIAHVMQINFSWYQNQWLEREFLMPLLPDGIFKVEL